MISRILVLMWQSIIFLFSAQPATDSKELSSGLTEMVLELIFPHMTPDRVAEVAEMLSFAVRKSAQFTIYMILGMLMYNCISRILSVKRKVAASLLFCFLYAVTDEIHQIFVDGRAGRVLDVCIDSVGSLCGIMIIAFVLTKTHHINHIKRRNEI